MVVSGVEGRRFDAVGLRGFEGHLVQGGKVLFGNDDSFRYLAADKNKIYLVRNAVGNSIPHSAGSDAAAMMPDTGASRADSATLSCPSGMVPIPGGGFRMGDGKYEHVAEVAEFCLDRTEVTVAMYSRCGEEQCSRTGLNEAVSMCKLGKEGRGEHPINCVTWDPSQGLL